MRGEFDNVIPHSGDKIVLSAYGWPVIGGGRRVRGSFLRRLSEGRPIGTNQCRSATSRASVGGGYHRASSSNVVSKDGTALVAMSGRRALLLAAPGSAAVSPPQAGPFGSAGCTKRRAAMRSSTFMPGNDGQRRAACSLRLSTRLSFQ